VRFKEIFRLGFKRKKGALLCRCVHLFFLTFTFLSRFLFWNFILQIELRKKILEEKKNSDFFFSIQLKFWKSSIQKMGKIIANSCRLPTHTNPVLFDLI
jgi:hypothetical protein